MPQLATLRCGIDVAGGGVLGSAGNLFVTLEHGTVNLLAVVGDPVASHGLPPHAAATMAAGSSFVTVNGGVPLALCRDGDLATCGHSAGGSGFVKLEE